MQLKQRDKTGRLKDSNYKILHMLALHPIFFQTYSGEKTTNESFEPGKQSKEPYSLLKVLKYSMEHISGDAYSSHAACLANEFLLVP